LADRVEIGALSYEEMPAAFGTASCMVLASLPSATTQLHPLDLPRTFWEEQFGMVLAESMASGLDILAADSGAIPEVLDGNGTLFASGDWPSLADRLREGPLAREPGQRVEYPQELLDRYSVTAMAERLASAYDRVA
jgi:glycosyltransferase involved in cell wall biosynthesis